MFIFLPFFQNVKGNIKSNPKHSQVADAEYDALLSFRFMIFFFYGITEALLSTGFQSLQKYSNC